MPVTAEITVASAVIVAVTTVSTSSQFGSCMAQRCAPGLPGARRIERELSPCLPVSGSGPRLHSRAPTPRTARAR